MKKFLLCTLVAMFVLVSAVSVSAAEEIGGWFVPDGFPLDGSDGEVSAPIVTVDANGVASVKSGGWYTNGESWGGVASVDRYELDGLEVTVEFSKVCEEGDRWINIGFFETPNVFQVGNIASNRGYGNLIRPSDPGLLWQHIEAISQFAPGAQPVDNTLFENEMVLTMKVRKDENGDWIFNLNGVDSNPYTGYDKIFLCDSAYVVVAASGQYALDKDSYTYTVTVNGKKSEATEEDLAAALKAIEDKEAEEAAAKEAAKEAAKAELEAAKAAKEAEKNGETVENTETENTETENTENTPADATGDDVAEEGSFPVVPVVVAVIVVLVIICAVVLLKKKKN